MSLADARLTRGSAAKERKARPLKTDGPSSEMKPYRIVSPLRHGRRGGLRRGRSLGGRGSAQLGGGGAAAGAHLGVGGVHRAALRAGDLAPGDVRRSEAHVVILSISSRPKGGRAGPTATAGPVAFTPCSRRRCPRGSSPTSAAWRCGSPSRAGSAPRRPRPRRR